MRQACCGAHAPWIDYGQVFGGTLCYLVEKLHVKKYHEECRDVPKKYSVILNYASDDQMRGDHHGIEIGQLYLMWGRERTYSSVLQKFYHEQMPLSTWGGTLDDD